MSKLSSEGLPYGWAMTTLGQITEEKISQAGPEGRRQFVYIDIGSIDNKAKRIIEPKSLPVSKAPSRAKQRLQMGDVLVSMTRPNLNAVAIVPSELDDSVGSTGFHVLRATEAVPSWLFYAVQTNEFVDAMCKLVQGALYPAVRPKDIRAYSVPLPPRPQQLRIVAELEKQFTRLEAGMAALKRVQANLKRYRAAILKVACEGRLVPTEAELARQEGRSYETGAQLLASILEERRRLFQEKLKAEGRPLKAYKEPQPPDTAHLPPLPDGWTYASVEQLGIVGEQVVLTGPFGTNLGRDDFMETGIPVLTISCLKGTGIHLDKAEFVSGEKARELDRYRLKPGDLLFSRMASVGRAGIVGEALRGALFNYHIMRLRLEPSILLAKYYIAYVRGSAQVERYIRDVNHGATRDGINTEQLLDMPVALPPFSEQQRIVDEVERRLSVMEGLESVVKGNLQRAARLRQSILQRTFCGELMLQTVPPETKVVAGQAVRV